MLKRSLPKVKTIRRLLKWGMVILALVAVLGLLQPTLWPGGFGIGKEQSVTTKSVETVVKDAQGNTTKTVETTKNDDGKTLWDWLSLIGVPTSLAILGYRLQRLQQERAETLAKEQRERDEKLAKEQREIAADETKEEILQVYFDRLSGLLVDKNLIAIAAKGNQATDEEQQLLDSSKDVIRARTLSILRRFENDPERKTSVIRFLIEADIISKLKLDLISANLSSVNLRGANLSNANLRDANLSSANLRGANLSSANLSDANLTVAELSNANLSDADLNRTNFCSANLSDAFLMTVNLMNANLMNADLTRAKLMNANLMNANLTRANLNGANLNGANLTNVHLIATKLSDAEVTDQQLQTAKLCYTELPEGSRLDPKRNCRELGLSSPFN
jgi:uncharacterized protein YjbI with pentapeptide repeats